jgi:hypothetical protein
MTDHNPDRVRELQAELQKTLGLLARQRAFYDDFLAGDYQKLGRGKVAAIVVAEVLTDYYTCVETLFWRISQFFENNLPADRWHAEVLRKMTLQVDGVRERVLSDGTFARLDELRRFRHFRRYYFEFDYDWGKLDYLLTVYDGLTGLLARDLTGFERFLDSLARRLESEKEIRR